MMEEEISPEQLKKWMEEGQEFTLVDIRESREREYARLEDDDWIPMGNLPHKIDSLKDSAQPIVLYCHHGQRSFHATQFLRNEDVPNAYSLAGGIHRWSMQLDESIPTY